MTVEAYDPPGAYTIAGVGPYAVNFPYVAGAVRATLINGDLRSDVALELLTVSPAAAAESGNLYLDATWAAENDGLQLEVYRLTSTEQGWEGVAGTREKGLEAQLDVLAMTQQEHASDIARALLFPPGSIIPRFVPMPADTVQRALMLSTSGLALGPAIADIAAAGEFATQARGYRDQSQEIFDDMVTLAGASGLVGYGGTDADGIATFFVTDLAVIGEPTVIDGYTFLEIQIG